MPQFAQRAGLYKHKRLIIIWLLTMIVTLTAIPGTGALAPDTTVRFEPADSVVGPYEAFVVQAVIEEASNLGAFQFRLAYDPSIVQVTEAALGDFLGSTGNSVIPIEPVVDNTEGRVTVGALSFGSTPGPDGTGVLATFSCIAQGEGSTTLELLEVQVLDMAASVQEATVEEGQVVVRSTGAPTPTITVAPRPTVTATPTSLPTATPVRTATATPPSATTATPVSTPTATPPSPPTATTVPAGTASPASTATATPVSIATTSPVPAVTSVSGPTNTLVAVDTLAPAATAPPSPNPIATNPATETPGESPSPLPSPTPTPIGTGHEAETPTETPLSPSSPTPSSMPSVSVTPSATSPTEATPSLVVPAVEASQAPLAATTTPTSVPVTPSSLSPSATPVLNPTPIPSPPSRYTMPIPTARGSSVGPALILILAALTMASLAMVILSRKPGG